MADRKRKTWLWVLGWIVCFPIPLTILMLRNRKLPPAARYGIIAVAWIALIVFSFAGRGGKSDEATTEAPAQEQQVEEPETTDADADVVTDEDDADEVTKEDEAIDEDTPSEAVQMISDDTLKAFVIAYEEISGSELEEVEQVGTQGFHAKTAGHTIELTYTTMNATIQIDNNPGGNFEDMRQIFHDAANALDPSMGDEAYSLFDSGVSQMSPEEDGFIAGEAFNADFSAPNEFEDGHIQLIVQK